MRHIPATDEAQVDEAQVDGAHVFVIDRRCYDRIPWMANTVCRCGAVPGAHHLGGGACAMELCPRCGDRAVVDCGCGPRTARVVSVDAMALSRA